MTRWRPQSKTTLRTAWPTSSAKASKAVAAAYFFFSVTYVFFTYVISFHIPSLHVWHGYVYWFEWASCCLIIGVWCPSRFHDLIWNWSVTNFVKMENKKQIPYVTRNSRLNRIQKEVVWIKCLPGSAGCYISQDHRGSDSVFYRVIWSLHNEWLFLRASARMLLNFHCHLRLSHYYISYQISQEMNSLKVPLSVLVWH